MLAGDDAARVPSTVEGAIKVVRRHRRGGQVPAAIPVETRRVCELTHGGGAARMYRLTQVAAQ